MLPPGTFTTSGLRNSADFRVHVAEDKNGWTGSSPLIVSFYAPIWLVLLEPQNAIIAFGIQSTPQSTMTFVKTLGLDMNVYDTTLGDEDNVYITKRLPHQLAYAAVCGIADADVKINDPLNKAIRTTIKAKVDRKTARIVELTGRIDFSLSRRSPYPDVDIPLYHYCNCRSKRLTVSSSLSRSGATPAPQLSNRGHILVCRSRGSHSWSNGR